MEIEAPNSGILHKLTAESSEEIAVGSTVGWIYGPGETPAPTSTPPMAPIVAPTVAPSAPPASPVAVPSVVITATPLARRLARQHAIALKGIIGSGPRCRIQARDVETAVKAGSIRAETPTAARPQPVSAGDDALYRTWLRQGEGRPLVLVHGFGADLNTWRPLIGSLRTDRPILGIDLPGHGRSPAAASPSLAGFAAAVAEALAAEGIDAADLIGHSLGAAVATQLADGATFDLRSLFLIAPAGLGPEINGDFISGFTRARSEASLGPWLRLLVGDDSAISEGFIRATARSREAAGVIAAQDAVARTLFPDGTQAFSIGAILGRLDMPIRAVFGTDDRIIPAGCSASLPGHVAIHRFKGIGHMPHIEAAPSLARILSYHLHV
jgi:pimeloyl-ACP methyl ester carboxylesterase